MSDSKGIIVFQGGGAFTAHDDLDRRLLAEVAAKKVVVLPTADAFERPEVWVTAAMSWGERLGVEIDALMVMRRVEAMETDAAGAGREAVAVGVVGDNASRLRSVLWDTRSFDGLTLGNVSTVSLSVGNTLPLARSDAYTCTTDRFDSATAGVPSLLANDLD
ncbi:MAG: hypothetical protein ACKOHN_11225, partial [Actinomycetota bacterium]